MRFDLWQTEREAAAIDPETGLKILRKDEPRILAYVWRPKGTNPYARYSFSTIERREEWIRGQIDAAKQHAARVKGYRDERKGTPEQWATIIPGMVWYTSWGYEQTNIEFYETVAVKGKYVVVRQLKQLSESVGWCQDKVRPAFGFYCGPEERHLVQWCGDRPSITFESFRHAWPWAGGARHATSYA